MNLFYSTLITDDAIILTEEEAWHCSKVLRMSPGEVINVTDGSGKLYECTLNVCTPKQCLAKINHVKQEEEQQGWKITIAIAPTKNIDRFEWFVEKSTEIGIDSIIPVFSAHSERIRIKPERIKKILLSAMKQSLKLTLPILENEIKFKDLIKKDFQGDKFIAYCESGTEEELVNQYNKGSDVIILIGPEGDFSPEEVDSAKSNGFKTVSLGKSRLRTETAGIVACSTIHILNKNRR